MFNPQREAGSSPAQLASLDTLLRGAVLLANNLLHEVVGAVDLAAMLGVVDDAVAQCILTLAVRIKRMLRALPR